MQSSNALRLRIKIYKILVLLCLWMAYACSFKFVSTYNSSLPIMPFTNTQSSLILAFGTGSTMAAKFFTGVITDKLGGWFVMLYSLLLQAVCGIIFAVSPQGTMWSFVASWSILRLGMAFYWVSQAVIMNNWFMESEYGTVSGVVTTASDFTDMLSCLLIGFLIDQFNVSWRLLFLLTSLFILLVVALLFVVLRQDPQSAGLPSLKEQILMVKQDLRAKEQEQQRQKEEKQALLGSVDPISPPSFSAVNVDNDDLIGDDVAANSAEESSTDATIADEAVTHPLEDKSAIYAFTYFLTSPRFWLILLNVAGLTSVQEALNWNRVILKEKHFSDGTASTLSSVFYLSSASCVLVSGWLFDHLSHLNRVTFMTGCNILMAVIAGLLWVFWDSMDKWLVFACIALIQGLYTPAYYIPVSAFSMSFGGPSHCGMITALLDVGGYCAAVFFDLIIGYVFEGEKANPWPRFFMIVCLLSIFSAVAIYLFLTLDTHLHNRKERELKKLRLRSLAVQQKANETI